MNRMHGIIFAYEQRGELRELTERRTAASMPFGGRYRAVDFALSNLLNAGVTDVGLVLHGRYQSMLDHVGSGKVWDMSRKRGGLHLLPPFNYLHEWGVTPFRGKMEALAGVREYLNEIRQDYVVLMEGDLVANLPLADILEQHIRTRADITADFTAVHISARIYITVNTAVDVGIAPNFNIYRAIGPSAFSAEHTRNSVLSFVFQFNGNANRRIVFLT